MCLGAVPVEVRRGTLITLELKLQDRISNHGFWPCNLCPLQQLPVLLIAKLSLKSHFLFKIYLIHLIKAYSNTFHLLCPLSIPSQVLSFQFRPC